MNFAEGRLERKGGGFVAKIGTELSIRVDEARFGGSLEPGREVTAGVRPHDVRVEGDGEGTALEASIVEALGAESYAHGTIGGVPPRFQKIFPNYSHRVTMSRDAPEVLAQLRADHVEAAVLVPV